MGCSCGIGLPEESTAAVSIHLGILLLLLISPILKEVPQIYTEKKTDVHEKRLLVGGLCY